MVLAFLDMLGVRDKWTKEGREGAEDTFIKFRNLIAHSLRVLDPDEIIEGVIETDAFVLVCKSTDSALKFMKKIYMDSFRQTLTNENNRIWLRGVVIPKHKDGEMRWKKKLNPPYDKVSLTLYSEDLFDAIALEKSGIKGMRVVVDKELINDEIRKKWIIKIDHLNFLTLKKLRNSSYPNRLNENYLDFLWMAEENDEKIIEIERLMALRLRKSANSQEEFIQAAATQLLFHEYSAMMGTIKKRVFYQNQRKLKIESR